MEIRRWKEMEKCSTSAHLTQPQNTMKNKEPGRRRKWKNKKIEIKSDEENGSFVVAHKLYLVGLTRSNM